MTHAKAVALALALVATACPGPQKPPCSPETRDGIRALYLGAAKHVIESGACDSVASRRVEDCAPYMVVEANFVAAVRACQ